MPTITYEEAKKEIAIGRYRHFKGNEYEVLAIARHSETQEPMVVYKALYGEQAVWVRPASMWTEEVPEPTDPNELKSGKSGKSDPKSGKRVKRFLRV